MFIPIKPILREARYSEKDSYNLCSCFQFLMNSGTLPLNLLSLILLNWLGKTIIIENQHEEILNEGRF